MRNVFVYAGDICSVPADGICTSTNPHLALMIGTGGAVRDAGGWAVQEACARIIEQESVTSGKKYVPAGSAHLTTAGALPFKGVIHCVASGPFHNTTVELIRTCVRNALAIADAEGWMSVAMPAFGTGHVAFRFTDAIQAMAAEIAATEARHLRCVVIASRERHQAEILAALAVEFPNVTWWDDSAKLRICSASTIGQYGLK